jgi:hypothetical protein
MLSIQTTGRRSCRYLLAGSTVLVLGASAAVQAAESAVGQWQPRAVRFDYLGAVSGSTYSCQGLDDTISRLLRGLASVRDLKIQPISCIPSYSTPSRFPSLMLRFTAFAPPGGKAGDASAGILTGTWKPILWSAHRPFPLEIGDCELIDELRLKVLPALAVRNSQSQLHCEPFQATSWSLSFDVLVPAAAATSP